MLGGIELELKDVRIVVFSPISRRLQMAAYLTAVGWEVQGAKEAAAPSRDPKTPAAQLEHRKSARAQLWLGIALLLIGAVLLIWNWQWVQSAIHGPTPITLEELNMLDDPATLANPWVTLCYDHGIDTGIELIERGRFSMILGVDRSKYVLIQVHDEWLVARVPMNHQGNEVVGYLDRWWTPLAREKLEEIKVRFPAYAFTPFQLDAAYRYRQQAFSMLGIVGLLMVSGVFVFGLSRGFWRRERHASAEKSFS
jgi:hypothetical protein